MLLTKVQPTTGTKPHIVRDGGVWRCSALYHGLLLRVWHPSPSVALREWLEGGLLCHSTSQH